MPGPDVAGPEEVRKILGGISRQRLMQIREKPDFPEHTQLAIGAVWDRAEMRAWQIQRLNKRRGPMLKAVRAYRRTGSVAAAARFAGVWPQTLRRWLRELDIPLPLD